MIHAGVFAYLGVINFGVFVQALNRILITPVIMAGFFCLLEKNVLMDVRL